MIAKPPQANDAAPAGAPEGERLRFLLEVARRRHALDHTLRGAEPFALTATILTALLVLTLMIFEPLGSASLLPLAVASALLIGLSSVLRYRRALQREAHPLRIAWEIDRRMGLRDAFATSLEIASTGEGGLFSSSLVKHTAERLDPDRIARAFPRSWFRPGWVTAGLLFAVLALLPVLERERGNGAAPVKDGLPELVTVPDLAGLTLGQARNTLFGRGLELGDVVEVPDLHRDDEVIGQTPASSKRVEMGTRVDLRLCVEGVRVPGVVGASLDAARKKLESADLVTGRVTRMPSPLGAWFPNLVLGQNPGRGRVVKRKGAVDLHTVEPVLQVRIPLPNGGVLNLAEPVPETGSPAPEVGANSGGEDGEGGRKPPLLGDPERTPAEFDDVPVKPLFGPEGKARVMEIEVPVPKVKGKEHGPGKGDKPEMEWTEMLVRYEKRAEHALNTGRIGRADRKTVIGYFERVRGMLGNGK